MDEPNRSMSEQQIEAMLIYMNQADPRIEPNAVNKRIWHRAVGRFEPGLVSDVFEDFVSKNDTKPTPSAIKSLCQAEFEKREREKNRFAITHDPSKMSLREFRERFPGRFLAAYQEGCRQVTGRENPNPPAWAFDGGGSVVRGLSGGKSV